MCFEKVCACAEIGTNTNKEIIQTSITVSPSCYDFKAQFTVLSLSKSTGASRHELISSKYFISIMYKQAKGGRF